MAEKIKHQKKSSVKTKRTTKNAIQKKASTADIDSEQLKVLKKYEKEIKDGIIKYYEMGALLQEIRDKKLYRAKKFNSFKDYCEETFHFGRSYGYRLIAYCRVWNVISDDDKKNIPERVIRALAQFKDDDEQIRACWEKAKEQSGNGLPGYEAVEQVVKDAKRQQLMDSKNFDQEANDDRIFLNCLKDSVSRDHAAEELIKASNTKFDKLLSAIKEARSRNIIFSDADQKKLTTALKMSIDTMPLFTDDYDE